MPDVIVSGDVNVANSPEVRVADVAKVEVVNDTGQSIPVQVTNPSSTMAMQDVGNFFSWHRRSSLDNENEKRKHRAVSLSKMAKRRFVLTDLVATSRFRKDAVELTLSIRGAAGGRERGLEFIVTPWAPTLVGATIDSSRVAIHTVSSHWLNAVSPHLFGSIEGLIGRFDYCLWRRVQGAPPGHADAHGHPDMFLSTKGPLLSPGLVRRPILPPDGKRGILYGPAKSLQQWNHPLCAAAVHDKRELLPSIAECQAEGGSFKAGRDEPKDLIP